MVAFEAEDDSGEGYLAGEGFADRRVYYSPGVTEDASSSFRGAYQHVVTAPRGCGGPSASATGRDVCS